MRSIAKQGDKSISELLATKILSRENMRLAYKSNNGSGGVNGIEIDEIDEHLIENWEEIREKNRRRRYRPQPVRRVEIPKLNDGVRNLGIPMAKQSVGFGDHYQAVAKTTGLHLINKEILEKRGLLSCLDYYLN